MGGKTDKQRIEKGEVLVRTIMEVLGAPKEHVEKTMMLLVDKLKEKAVVDVVSEEVFEAQKTEDGKLFTAYSEIELWMPLNQLPEFAIAFMPSSIEILEPSSIKFTCEHLSAFMNTIMKNLHTAEEVYKGQAARNKNLEHKSSTLLRNFVLHALKQKGMTSEELSKVSGIPAEQLETFLDLLTKGGTLENVKGKYSLRK